MTRRLVSFGLLAAVTLAAGLGCGRGGEKGVNQDKDRPRPADTKR